MRTMSKTFALMLTLIASLAATSQAGAIESARDLVKYCQHLEKGTKGTGDQIRIPNTRQALICWGYMESIQDLSVLSDERGRRFLGACPPEQTTLLHLIHSFLTYARSHTGELHEKAAVVVIKALQEAFPCHQFEGTAYPPGERISRAGGLASYGVNAAGEHRRAATSISRK
jgi:Ssp1 endopeptidase immunity protein Rap1a